MSFEKTLDGDSTKIPYDRGADMNGNSKVIMKNGANIGTSGGRPGNVLRMTGTNAGADAGYFYTHYLKYVRVIYFVTMFCTIFRILENRYNHTHQRIHIRIYFY